MTDPASSPRPEHGTPADGATPPPHLERAVTALRRHAFAALLAGPGSPRIADVAEAASRDTTGVAQAMAWLEGSGALERDGDHLVGAHGLTTRNTPHTMAIGDRALHTWCAYDALAIPVALAATARADTTCPTCGRPLAVDIDAGRLPGGGAFVLWLPTGPCRHVIDDFCAHANLFCTTDHLDTWRSTSGDPAGRPVSLAEVPSLAHTAWADVAAPWRGTTDS
jgi:alkylmercury lyase